MRSRSEEASGYGKSSDVCSGLVMARVTDFPSLLAEIPYPPVKSPWKRELEHVRTWKEEECQTLPTGDQRLPGVGGWSKGKCWAEIV